MTFSIVATDGRAIGVAVASKFVAVGAVVPAVALSADGTALVGAVATQAAAKWSYKDDALALLRRGASADEAVAQVTAADEERETRQLGVVAPASEATHTGSACMPWAGGRSGSSSDGSHGTERYAIQGNILTGEDVVAGMERAWLATAGQALERRLVAALLAGDDAGGDSRGRQGAALLVAAPGEGYDRSGIRVDLRVDDHPAAPRELARLLDLHELYFGGPEGVQALTGDLGIEVAERLAVLGFEGPDALDAWAGVENYEMRLTGDGIDRRVLAALRAATD